MGRLVFRVASDWQEVVRLRTEIEKLKQTLLSMDSTQSPDTFKKLNTQLGESSKKFDELVTEAAKAGAVIEGNFKKKIFDASQSVNGFTEKIIAQKNTIKGFEQTLRAIQEEYRKITKNGGRGQDRLDSIHRMKNIIAEEKDALFNLTQQQANARLSVSKLRQEYSLYKDDSVKVVSANDDIVGSMKQFILTIAGADAIKSFISNIVEISGNFQKMESVLGNTLGSASKAKETMDMLADFGARTPFQVDELTAAYVKLANQGFTPTMSQMKKLGDLASSTGKSFDQLAEAIIDAQVGENERLKEFGIRASKNGDKVTYTFKEQETTIQNTASAIREYILSLGDLEGVVGANEKISATFVGRLSNIQDELTNQFKNFGEQFNSELSDGIDVAALLVENLNSIIPVIGGLVTAYGAYKAAVIAVNAAHKAGALFDNIRLIGMMRKELGLATAAQQAFNTASKANVYTALVSVLIGLGTAVYMFTKKANEATDANNSLNKVSKNASEEYAKQASRIDRLTGSLKSETASLTLKRDKLKELKGLIPGYNAELNEEGKLINNNTEAIKAYLTQLEKQIKLKAAQEELEELYRQKRLQEKDIKAKQEYAEREKNKVPEVVYGGDLGIEAQRQALSRAADAENALKQANSELKITEANIEQIQKEIEDTSLSTSKGESVETQNKAYWEKQKKDAETQLEALSDIEANGKKGLALKQKIQEYENKIKAYSSKEVTPNTNSIISQSEKIAEIEQKQAVDRQRQQEDLENQIAQSRIDALDKGYEKERAQRELNNKKEILSLQRQKEDYISAYTQAQKELFDAQEDLKAKKDSKYKKKIFDSSSVSVDTSAFDTIIDNTGQRQTREQSEYYKELLSKYQSYTEKRLAAQEKFQKDREILIKAGASNETLAEHDYQRDETLKSIDNEFAMREDSFKAWADSITDISLEKLRELLAQAEQELQNLETLNPNDPKLASQRAKVTSLKNTISERSEKAKTSPDKRSLKDWQDLYKTLSKVEKEFDEIGKTVGGTAGEIVSAAGGITSSTLQMIDGIMMLSNSASWSMTATATAAQKAIKMVENASVILAVISAALQVTTKIFDLFGRDTTTEKYEEAKDAYQSYINILDKVIDKQLELAETLTGDNANAAYEKAIEMVKTQSEAARVLGKQYLNSGASWKSRSKGYEEVKNMSLEGWVDAAKALDMSVEQFKNVMGGRMTGLFDLTDDQLTQLQENAHIFWAQLDSDTQNYANQIAEGVIQVKEVLEQQMSDVTLIDVDGLRNDFQDLLTDMDSDTADFAGNFEEYMRNAILNSMLKESYMDRLKKWREKFYNAMDDGMTQKEYEDLKAEGQQISGEMKAERDKLKDIFGWTDSYSQASSKGSFQTMSQDTGNELNGRFTALQMSGEEIKTHSILQTQSLNILTMKADAILSVNMESRNIADEIRTVQVNSYLELQEIRQNTGDTVKQLKLMDEKLKKIESNTNKL